MHDRGWPFSLQLIPHFTLFMMGIPALEYTAVDEIPSIAKGLRNTFNTHKTRPIEVRILESRFSFFRSPQEQNMLRD